MKKMQSLSFLLICLFINYTVLAQSDKSKRPSPPALVKQTLVSGATISIDYSQPSVKGRIIGKNLEPKDGEVWRTGANEATVFETNKPIKVEGKDLAAGKYGLFSIAGKDNWVVIFNKTWDQWGASDYKADDDALRINVKPQKAESFAERMTFTIDKNGLVTLSWGDIKVSFIVQ